MLCHEILWRFPLKEWTETPCCICVVFAYYCRVIAYWQTELFWLKSCRPVPLVQHSEMIWLVHFVPVCCVNCVESTGSLAACTFNTVSSRKTRSCSETPCFSLAVWACRTVWCGEAGSALIWDQVVDEVRPRKARQEAADEFYGPGLLKGPEL